MFEEIVEMLYFSFRRDSVPLLLCWNFEEIECYGQISCNLVNLIIIYDGHSCQITSIFQL
jgi:hypothetical protein